jgi:hypothetical protein
MHAYEMAYGRGMPYEMHDYYERYAYEMALMRGTPMR